MKSELQGFRDLSAFRHFEIGVLYALGGECTKKLADATELFKNSENKVFGWGSPPPRGV